MQPSYKYAAEFKQIINNIKIEKKWKVYYFCWASTWKLELKKIVRIPPFLNESKRQGKKKNLNYEQKLLQLNFYFFGVWKPYENNKWVGLKP